MKLRFETVWSFLGMLAVSVTLFSGCASAPEPVFTSDPMFVAGTNGSPQISASREGMVFQVGDSITVTFADAPDQLPPFEERIKEDGNITLPYNVVVKAVGKSPGELQKEIRDRYVPKYYVRLTVTVKYAAIEQSYYVMGEVRSPGPKPYTGVTTVTKAIATAGGLTDFADKDLVLTRSKGQKIKVNYKKAIKDPKADLQVYPGDSINVERSIW